MPGTRQEAQSMHEQGKPAEDVCTGLSYLKSDLWKGPEKLAVVISLGEVGLGWVRVGGRVAV